MTNTVVIFGAGATKACGGPLTNEILPDALKLKAAYPQEGHIALVERFLVENFHLPEDESARRPEHFPSLPLLLSLIDIAVDRKHSLGSAWNADALIRTRHALEFATFTLLEHALSQAPTTPYFGFIDRLWPVAGNAPSIITLNYDILADLALNVLSEQRGEFGFADYGCDIADEFYRARPHFGTLLKLHGSMNWLYCPGCERLRIAISQSGRRAAKMLDLLWSLGRRLETKYGYAGGLCDEDRCGAAVSPVLIAPAQRKDYRNPHIAQVWYRAERTLRAADRVIIVGYSLPEDDVDVAYVLKRSLGTLAPQNITIVEKDAQRRTVREHPVGRRYAQLFGTDIDWRTEGFSDWVQAHPLSDLHAFETPLPVVPQKG